MMGRMDIHKVIQDLTAIVHDTLSKEDREKALNRDISFLESLVEASELGFYIDLT